MASRRESLNNKGGETITRELRNTLLELAHLRHVTDSYDEVEQRTYESIKALKQKAFQCIQEEGYDVILALLADAGIFQFMYDERRVSGEDAGFVAWRVERVFLREAEAMVEFQNTQGVLMVSVPPPIF